MKKLFVGGIPFRIELEELKAAFAEYGEVASAQIVKDRETGRSRGFAFVEMSNDEDAKKAIEGLNGSDLQGRNIVVNEARERSRN